MANLQELKEAIAVLEGTDVEAVKKALAIIGDPVPESTATNSSALPFEVGKQYLVRTITYFQVGRLEKITGNFLIFEDASWIPDTGRFMDTLKNGKFDEIEPVGTAIVNTASIIDAFPFTPDLPKEQK